MEEKAPWELGSSPYLVKNVKKMKKMEERESRAEERERDGRDSEKLKRKGDSRDMRFGLTGYTSTFPTTKVGRICYVGFSRFDVIRHFA
ncbi:hypothetical protein Q3G72_000406 [Acer saccharum]|nr:hypothetical protein Q3G72_000406 [Acer saccharum]